ncbi:hypothetical protein CK203_108370 [Vitis vinifera]|uniref:Uncharacterized protein n=1 Tax=Vitis vinifera TaxID=29760 RepID=A0A438CU65_VITVI|nr:hypothetical protein CK203_108370 [Vitis vinifera]
MSTAMPLLRKCGGICATPSLRARSFRSNAALEAIAKASEERIPNIALYNYPHFLELSPLSLLTSSILISTSLPHLAILFR